jgi:hypothetical protein
VIDVVEGAVFVDQANPEGGIFRKVPLLLFIMQILKAVLEIILDWFYLI